MRAWLSSLVHRLIFFLFSYICTEACSKRATYLSKTTQNQLLECMGSVILESILSDVKASQYFSVLADEVTDISGWEQLGVALRFVKDGKAEKNW